MAVLVLSQEMNKAVFPYLLKAEQGALLQPA